MTIVLFSKADGICFVQTAANEKENEIVPIPDLLNEIKVVVDYFADDEFKEKIKTEGGYLETNKKAHGQIEKLVGFQTKRIGKTLNL